MFECGENEKRERERERERETERERKGREKKGRDTRVLGSREMLVGHLRQILAYCEFITEYTEIL